MADYGFLCQKRKVKHIKFIRPTVDSWFCIPCSLSSRRLIHQILQYILLHQLIIFKNIVSPQMMYLLYNLSLFKSTIIMGIFVSLQRAFPKLPNYYQTLLLLELLMNSFQLQNPTAVSIYMRSPQNQQHCFPPSYLPSYSPNSVLLTQLFLKLRYLAISFILHLTCIAV